MRKVMMSVLMLTAAAGVMSALGRSTRAQTTPSSAAAPRATLLGGPSNKLEDALLEWPLPPGEQAYGKIDGKHLHKYSAPHRIESASAGRRSRTLISLYAGSRDKRVLPLLPHRS
jgi:hypothetical protein